MAAWCGMPPIRQPQQASIALEDGDAVPPETRSLATPTHPPA